jgi:hypothetical protein
VSIRLKLDPIDRDLAVILEETMGPKARSRALAEFAREARDEAVAQNTAAIGKAPRYTTHVDGRLGAPLESVKPDGVIVFEFELLLELLEWIGEQLVLASPIGQSDDPRPGHPGLYANSHGFYADDTLLEPGTPVPPAREYAFVNSVPYARKIERGLSDQAPTGVYQVIADQAKRRFGNVANIRFTYRVPKHGDIETWARTTSLVRMRKRGPARMTASQRDEWLRRQPAIVISTGAQ